MNYFYRFKNYSMSEEEDQIKLKNIVFVDFEPFVALSKIQEIYQKLISRHQAAQRNDGWY